MPIIQVENVNKDYQLGQMVSFSDNLKKGWARLRGQPIPVRKPFRALNDVSFSVDQGEVLGIIGTNGAGKSTLLKLISKITNPTSGKIVVNGKIAPLIEVGAGLHPELTGRENIFLNASIMGVPRSIIRKRFDEIVSFSEIEAFIDTPIKRYSSGMMVRLGFSIATSVDADILVVDEVLAVGDLAFQRKCFDRTEHLIKKQGRTVLLVSHNIRQIERICTRVILLDQGRIALDGEPHEVCDAFYSASQKKISENSLVEQSGRQKSTGEIEIVDLFLKNNDKKIDSVETGSDCVVHIRLNSKKPLENITIGIGLHTTDFVYLTTHNSEISHKNVLLKKGLNDIRFKIKEFPFLEGVYMLRMGITCGRMYSTIYYGENILKIVVRQSAANKIPASMRQGFILLDGEWEFEN